MQIDVSSRRVPELDSDGHVKDKLGTLAIGTAVYGIGGFLARALNLLLLPVLTAYLSPADFGAVALLTQVSFLLSTIFTLGSGSALAIIYFSKQDRLWRDSVIWTAFCFLSASSLLVLLCGVLLSHRIASHIGYNGDSSILVMMCFVYASLSIIASPLALYLQFEQRARTFAAVSLLTTILTLCLSLAFVIGLHLHAEGMLAATVLSQAANAAILLLLTMRATRFHTNLTVVSKLISIGTPFIPAFLFLFVIGQSSRFILQWHHGAQAVGIFSLGYSLGFAMTIPVESFVNAWTPYFLGFMEQQDASPPLFRRIFTYYVLFFGSLSLLFYLAAKPAVMILANPAYRGAYPVVGLTATSQFFIGIFSIFLIGPYLAKDVKPVVLVQLVAALATLTTGWFLVARFSVMGAALTLVVGYAAMAALQFLWNLHRRAAYLHVQYEWSRIAHFTALYVVVALLMLRKRSDTLRAELVTSTVVLLAFLLCVYLLLDGEERSTLARLVRAGAAVLKMRPPSHSVAGLGDEEHG